MMIKKTIDLNKDLVVTISTFAQLENRSFNGQVRQLLDEALTNRTVQDEK
jgi:hypothetical protein